ncbi:hypothetical protein TNCV_4132291 [Trichonephila clavipes]|nr:hypothetical protein TNCV_4132291 [Trichonephila clavipes]
MDLYNYHVNFLFSKTKLSGATDYEGQGLLCPSQETGSLGVEVNEQVVNPIWAPNIKPTVTSLLRTSCWTRHPHVHLAAAAQPLFDPRGIEHRRPEEERREML